MAVYVQQTVTAAATAASTAGSWIPLDWKSGVPVALGLNLDPAQGHLDARVQITFDMVTEAGVSGNAWSTTVSAQATAAQANIFTTMEAPPVAVRLVIASGSGTAGQVKATLTVMQGTRR